MLFILQLICAVDSAHQLKNKLMWINTWMLMKNHVWKLELGLFDAALWDEQNGINFTVISHDSVEGLFSYWDNVRQSLLEIKTFLIWRVTFLNWCRKSLSLLAISSLASRTTQMTMASPWKKACTCRVTWHNNKQRKCENWIFRPWTEKHTLIKKAD